MHRVLISSSRSCKLNLRQSKRLRNSRSIISFSTQSTFNGGTSQAQKPVEKAHRISKSVYMLLLGVTSLTSSCIYARIKREEHLDLVPLASQSDAFYIKRSNHDEEDSMISMGESPAYHHNLSNNNSNGSSSNLNGKKVKRDLKELTLTVARAGLMGNQIPGAQSVKEELAGIRSWHRERGFHGGLVLRELTQPLYNINQPTLESGDDVDIIPTAEQLPQRECYYLYYEMKPNGHSLQQIFCRGTTVRADVYSCLNFQFLYDDELKCYLHSGFRNHAHRLLEDLEPLIRHAKHNSQATIEICGHSLGGAVAMITAMKLKQRGYNVTKVTSIAGARFCSPDCVDHANSLLPEDALRIENDLDGVQYLPPWSCALGDKLWFVSGGDGKHSTRYLSRRDILASSLPSSSEGEGGKPVEDQKRWNWVDSIYWTGRIPEMLKALSKTHRVRCYVSRMEELIKEIEDTENKQISTASTIKQ